MLKSPPLAEEPWALPRAYPSLADAWARLAAYLGGRFDPRLTEFDVLRRFLDREWAQLGPSFYRQSIGYLYDLTFFHYMDAKDPFFRLVTEFAGSNGITSMADIGCGTALDAQSLLQAGYEVDGFDLENPSLSYARWRLDQDLPGAGRILPIGQLPGRRYQLAYAVDVIGHADDPLALIGLMTAHAEHVAINLPPHDSRHRCGPADLHPSLDHARVLPVLQEQAELLILAPAGRGVVTVCRSRICTRDSRGPR